MLLIDMIIAFGMLAGVMIVFFALIEIGEYVVARMWGKETARETLIRLKAEKFKKEAVEAVKAATAARLEKDNPT